MKQEYESLLENIGLSKHEACVFEVLLSIGQGSAQAIIKKSGLKRPTAYYILSGLEKRGLVETLKNKKKREFRLASPENLEKILAGKEAEFLQTKKMLEYSLPGIISQYMLSMGKPFIVHYEGVAGIRKLYTDILREKKDIFLIRSPYDENIPELARLVERQITSQVKNLIHTRAITPQVPETIETVATLDPSRLVTRRIVPKEKFMTPAQIIIYGEKIAITSFRKPMLTTIIENRDIRDTFMTLFEYIWESATPEHNQIIETIKAKYKNSR